MGKAFALARRPRAGRWRARHLSRQRSHLICTTATFGINAILRRREPALNGLRGSPRSHDWHTNAYHLGMVLSN